MIGGEITKKEGYHLLQLSGEAKSMYDVINKMQDTICKM
jgi:hypothetical protein